MLYVLYRLSLRDIEDFLVERSSALAMTLCSDGETIGTVFGSRVRSQAIYLNACLEVQMRNFWLECAELLLERDRI